MTCYNGIKHANRLLKHYEMDSPEEVEKAYSLSYQDERNTTVYQETISPVGYIFSTPDRESYVA